MDDRDLARWQERAVGEDGSMKLTALAVDASGRIRATLTTGEDEAMSVAFTTSNSEGITVAHPEPDAFTGSDTSADGVRRIVAAVIAFERAALD